jgi:hypothetical protein
MLEEMNPKNLRLASPTGFELVLPQLGSLIPKDLIETNQAIGPKKGSFAAKCGETQCSLRGSIRDASRPSFA